LIGVLAFDMAGGYRVMTLDSNVNGKAMNFSKGKYRVIFMVEDRAL
jgi:hypothetical protein